MFQAKFDDMTYFLLNMLKQNSKSVTRVCFAMLYEFQCIVLKMNQGCASISIHATPPKQRVRYVNETFRVDSPYTEYYTVSSMIMYNFELYFNIFRNTILFYYSCMDTLYSALNCICAYRYFPVDYNIIYITIK